MRTAKIVYVDGEWHVVVSEKDLDGTKEKIFTWTSAHHSLEKATTFIVERGLSHILGARI